MLGKKKSTAPDKNEQKNDVQFQKNIKTLWIYTSLFCAFALVLIIVSSVIQGKINSDAEYYQDKYDKAQSSNQSTIKNIQDENAALKRDIAKANAELEILNDESESNTDLLNNSAELLLNAEYLLDAYDEYINGTNDNARTSLAKVNSQMLTDKMKSVYDMLNQKLN